MYLHERVPACLVGRIGAKQKQSRRLQIPSRLLRCNGSSPPKSCNYPGYGSNA